MTVRIWSLKRRIEYLRSVPERESRPSGGLPGNEAFRDASAFLDRLPFPLSALPHISVADDGEVNFAWDCRGVHIDLGFYGDGAFSYYARAADGREYYGEDVPAGSPLPAALESLLRA